MPGQATVVIRGKRWSVNVATTSQELSRGLAGIASIPPYTGMLFDLGSERIVTVNAYGMLFPLSVVFIGTLTLPGGPGSSEVLAVTEVAPLLAPGDEGTTSYPCRYFLEVNVGEANGVDPGDLVTITGYTPTTTASVIGLMVTVLIVAMMMSMMVKAVKGAK